MPDQSLPLRRPQFGFCLPLFASPGVIAFRTPSYRGLEVGTTMSLAVQADELGYDSLWVADHLQLGKDDAILEGWTTLAALAGATHRAKLGPIHLCNAFREPSLMAKMSATLDQISNGRLIFFFDAGWRQVEFDAYGFPFFDAPTRIERCREGLEVIRRLWTNDGPVTYEGQHYQIRAAVNAPRPRQQPHPPIWIGEVRDGLADLAAAFADGWNSVPATLADYGEKLDVLRAACSRYGRDVSQLELSLETQILIATDRSELRRKVEWIDQLRTEADSAAIPDPHQSLKQHRDAWLVGTPDDIIDQLRAYQGLGVSHFLLWFLDAPHPGGLRLFADKVMPVLRDAA